MKKFWIEEKNGLFRVYTDKPVITGIKTFRTKRAAEKEVKAYKQ